MLEVSELVYLSNSVLVTDSQRVAKHFGKKHHNVLRAYDRLACSAKFNQLNFESVEQADAKGESRRLIRMSKDGLVFLVMGFTGPEAAKIKERYIGAFNEMAGQLQGLSMSLWEQRLQLEKRDDLSFTWASFGAKRMNERRRDLPQIRGAMARIDAELQPPLFIGDHVPTKLTAAPRLKNIGKGHRAASNDATARKPGTRKRV